MIRRQGNNLIWPQKGFGRVTVAPEEAGYGPAAATEDLQIAAESANFAAEDAYLKELAREQVNVDASRPIDAIPVKPLYVSVSDPVMDRSGNVTPGVQTKTPWPEPLPELVPKMIYKSGASAPSAEPIVIK